MIRHACRRAGRAASAVAAGLLLGAVGGAPARAQATPAGTPATGAAAARRDTLRVAFVDRRAGSVAGGAVPGAARSDEPVAGDSARSLDPLRDELARALAARWAVVLVGADTTADVRMAVLAYAHTDHLPWQYGDVAIQVDVASPGVLGAAAAAGTVARATVRRWDVRSGQAAAAVLAAARARAVRHAAAFVDSVRAGSFTRPP